MCAASSHLRTFALPLSDIFSPDVMCLVPGHSNLKFPGQLYYKQYLHCPLAQWFSTFLILQPFKIILQAVATPNYKIHLLLYICNFATVMSRNVSIYGFR